MKYSIGLFTSILIAFGWPLVSQQLGAEQSEKPHLADIRIDHDVSVENWRILDIFLYLLRGSGLHGGIAEMAVCSDLPKGRLQIKQGVTVRQAMDSLVAANPRYKWELRDGVINLMPRASTPLLQTKIVKFQRVATDREIEAVLQDLLRLPEVQRSEAALGLRQGISGGGLSGGQEHPIPKQPVPVQFNMKGLLLQDALNKIVQGSPKGVWVYHENDCNGARTFVIQVASNY